MAMATYSVMGDRMANEKLFAHQNHSYKEMVASIHKAIGIPKAYGVEPHLPLHLECQELVKEGKDLYGRDIFLSERTAESWRAMKCAAALTGAYLIPVSGFRSVERQREIIENKTKRGEKLLDILKINAAPGFSQHHTGCALDLTDSKDSNNALEESFESQPAFEWLCKHGGAYGFRLEYGRDNPHGFIYEPWHWVFSEVDTYTDIKNW